MGRHLLFRITPLFTVLGMLGACAAESTPPPPSSGTQPAEPAPSGSAAPVEPSQPDPAGPKDAGAKPSDPPPPPPDLPTNDAGCLTYAAAAEVCGFKSDESVCNFALGCGATTNLGQCKINCEMQSTVTCFAPADAACLLAAVSAKSCTALKACKWKL